MVLCKNYSLNGWTEWIKSGRQLIFSLYHLTLLPSFQHELWLSGVTETGIPSSLLLWLCKCGSPHHYPTTTSNYCPSSSPAASSNSRKVSWMASQWHRRPLCLKVQPKTYCSLLSRKAFYILACCSCLVSHPPIRNNLTKCYKYFIMNISNQTPCPLRLQLAQFICMIQTQPN